VPDHLLVFLVGSVLVTIVPGADMALVTRQVVTRGRGPAQATIFGNLSGLVVHATALVVGLSAFLVASATAYTVVKLAGAAYLGFLGVQSLRQARRSPRPPSPPACRRPGRRAARVPRPEPRPTRALPSSFRDGATRTGRA